MKLLCRNYTIDRSVGRMVEIRAGFILKTQPYDSKAIAETLKDLETLFASGIDIVQTVKDKNRCQWCATLNDVDNNICTQCGGVL